MSDPRSESKQVCSCGHRIERDHKRTMRGDFFCYLCPDSSRCAGADIGRNGQGRGT